jgi:hypothetical protein
VLLDSDVGRGADAVLRILNRHAEYTELDLTQERYALESIPKLMEVIERTQTLEYVTVAPGRTLRIREFLEQGAPELGLGSPVRRVPLGTRGAC